MKLLIIGASGLVGWNLRRVAQAAGHEVIGTYASFAAPGLLPLRLDDATQTKKLVQAMAPDVVVCCAAWSWVDGCQSDRARAFRENRDLPANAARAAASVGARFLHFSTSYVFDGADGPYLENAKPNPLSVYAASKLAGEVEVAEVTRGEAIIVRTMGVYGAELQQKNFVYQLRSKLENGERMQVPCDQFGNATDAINLADGCLDLLQAGAQGIWNIAGAEANLNRADFALQIARSYRLDESLIERVPTDRLGQPAPRPKQAGLRTDKMTAATPWRPIAWRPIAEGL